ncbi:BMC domain-containing protein [Silvimonas iriomotensis]|uniref:Ethanolamine utilization protein EutK n=1 Tax=Silvimonas iriomotensis TaxID=449662 RepID=A0ABQ2PAY2_9NEIS|nr:BMC domain-containing protein [Silvimonas iriomotensis]GGP22504.1 ethanolamine utilization protein EutK [Silvimonas iriomotensis]
MINALGLLEVRGLATALEAADAMLKSANVRLLRQWQTDPGMISLIVEGDLAACRAALDAGTAAAARLGEVVSRQDIGRPDPDTERLIMQLLAPPPATPAPPVAPLAPAVAPAVPAPAPLAQSAAAPAPAAAVPDEAGVLAAIAATPQGMTLTELQARFPDMSIHRRWLEALCRAGHLHRRQGRYVIAHGGPHDAA